LISAHGTRITGKFGFAKVWCLQQQLKS